jgi:hypothetical protein
MIASRRLPVGVAVSRASLTTSATSSAVEMMLDS